MNRAESWDRVDGYLARIQLGEWQLIETVRADLAVLRHVQGESAPRRAVAANIAAVRAKPGMDDVTESRAKGFTGIPCEQCGSLDTVRNGTCLTCTVCLHAGECG